MATPNVINPPQSLDGLFFLAHAHEGVTVQCEDSWESFVVEREGDEICVRQTCWYGEDTAPLETFPTTAQGARDIGTLYAEWREARV